MPSPKQYQRIAERYATAAGITNSVIPEASGFSTYHAFESIGCAWIRHRGYRIPRPHLAKINLFVRLCRGYRFGRGAATLASVLSALRNQMLYPVPDGTGNYILPETVISAQDAANLLHRVQGLIQHISSNL